MPCFLVLTTTTCSEYPKDAFDKYIGRNGLAYVERLKLTPVEAVKILVENGALPVMAHPTYSATKSDRDEVGSLRDNLTTMKAAGLVGVEVYYGDYTDEQVTRLATVADEMGLVPCGGSDYHALKTPDEMEPGTVGPPVESLRRLAALAGARGEAVAQALR